MTMDEELTRKLDHLLNSPEGMEKIQDMMKALGIASSTTGGETTLPAEPPLPKSTSVPDEELAGTGLLNLAPLLQSLGKEDQNTALLKALRPYLHGGREKRLDESLKLMQLLKILPLLEQRGGLLG